MIIHSPLSIPYIPVTYLSFCDPILFLSIYSFSALVMISVSVFGLGHFLWLSNHFFRFINSILNIGICPCVLMSIVTKTKEILTKIFLKWYIEVIFGTKLGEYHCTLKREFLYFCLFVLTAYLVVSGVCFQIHSVLKGTRRK